MLRRYRPSERPTIPFAQAASNNGKLGLWRRNRPPSLMLLSWPPHRGNGRAMHKQAATSECRRVRYRLLSHPPHTATAPLDRILKAAGRACTSTSQPPCRSPRTRSVPRAEALELPRLFMLGTGAQEAGSAKIQHPSLLLGDTSRKPHKWPLASFLRIGTLRRHLAPWTLRKHPFCGKLWRTSTRFY